MEKNIFKVKKDVFIKRFGHNDFEVDDHSHYKASGTRKRMYQVWSKIYKDYHPFTSPMTYYYDSKQEAEEKKLEIINLLNSIVIELEEKVEKLYSKLGLELLTELEKIEKDIERKNYGK